MPCQGKKSESRVHPLKKDLNRCTTRGEKKQDKKEGAIEDGGETPERKLKRLGWGGGSPWIRRALMKEKGGGVGRTMSL